MDSLQSEIDTLGWGLNVRFLGLNEIGHGVGNTNIPAVSDLPWLQDNTEQKVWDSWDVTFRDIVILDEQNVPVATFNVTTYNLGVSANYDSLRTLLGTFAQGSSPLTP
jgi:hypothetical protein